MDEYVGFPKEKEQSFGYYLYEHVFGKLPFGEVHYVNGDKPVLRLIDGVPYAFGTPWRGKEGYGRAESAPLEAIALLERAENNVAVPIPYGDGTIRLMKQIYIPKNPTCASLAMRVADKILTTVRFVELRCNMDKEAAHVAARAMTND
jgi:hypothetical protein